MTRTFKISVVLAVMTAMLLSFGVASAASKSVRPSVNWGTSSASGGKVVITPKFGNGKFVATYTKKKDPGKKALKALSSVWATLNTPEVRILAKKGDSKIAMKWFPASKSSKGACYSSTRYTQEWKYSKTLKANLSIFKKGTYKFYIQYRFGGEKGKILTLPKCVTYKIK